MLPSPAPTWRRERARARSALCPFKQPAGASPRPAPAAVRPPVLGEVGESPRAPELGDAGALPAAGGAAAAQAGPGRVPAGTANLARIAPFPPRASRPARTSRKLRGAAAQLAHPPPAAVPAARPGRGRVGCGPRWSCAWAPGRRGRLAEGSLLHSPSSWRAGVREPAARLSGQCLPPATAAKGRSFLFDWCLRASPATSLQRGHCGTPQRCAHLPNSWRRVAPPSSPATRRLCGRPHFPPRDTAALCAALQSWARACAFSSHPHPPSAESCADKQWRPAPTPAPWRV
ncbi:hypothetical protein NN561_002666 [Cricetulus griseus]